jgi:hypothetical protein
MIFKLYSRQSNHDNTTTGRSRADAGVYSSKIYGRSGAGVDAARHPHLGPQQLQFRERLTQEIMTHTRLRPGRWRVCSMKMQLRLGGKTGRDADPGHLALTLMAEKLIALRQQTHPRPAVPGLMQQYAELSSHLPNAPPIKKRR